MLALPEVVELVLAADTCSERLAIVRELDRTRRGDLVRALKDELDRRVHRRPPEAVRVGEAMVDCAAGDLELEALALRGRAVAAYYNGRAEQSVRDFRAAAERYERVGQDLEAACVHRSLIDVYQSTGRIAEALESADRARLVFERLGETHRLAQVDVNVAVVHMMRLDDHAAARRCFERALGLFREVGDRSGEAIVLFNLAQVELEGNRVDEAEAAWRAARAAFEELDMPLRVADCDYNLAYLESRRSRFAAALEGLERARAEYARHGKPEGEPDCRLDLAEAYLRIDAGRDALRHAEEARRAYAALGSEYQAAKAEALAARARLRLGESDAARALFERAAATFERLGNTLAGATQRLQARLASAAVLRPEDASSWEELARRLRAQGSDHLADLCVLELARGELARGELDGAEARLAGRLSAAPRTGGLDALVEIEALRAVAACELARGSAERAAHTLGRALERVEAVYDTIPRTDLRRAFFRGLDETYRELAALLADGGAGERRRALLVLESGRLRSLHTPRQEPRRLGGEYRRERKRLDWLLSRRLDAVFGEVAGDHELKRALPDEAEIRASEERLAELARRAPDPRAARHRPLAAAELDAFAEDELVLALLPPSGDADARGDVDADARRRWRALALHGSRDGGSRVDTVELDATTEQVRALRDRLRHHLGKLALGRGYVDARRERLQAAVRPVLDELGARLLAPALREGLPAALTIVPGGADADLPYHAFRVGGRELARDVEVGYAPSVTHRLRAAVRAPGSPDGRLLLAGGGESEPAAARAELAELRHLYGARAETLTPAELHERLRCGGAGALHLAGHGWHEKSLPQFSAVAVGGTCLLAQDVAELELDLRLVTLGACESGLERHSGGERIGLATALLAAGVRCVVASLWPVDDDDAAALLTGFYERLARGDEARAALASVQRELLEEGALPASWAGFVLHGDPHVRLPASPGDSA